MGDDQDHSSVLRKALAERAAMGRKLRAFIYARRSYDPNGLARAVSDQLHEGRRTCEHNDWPVAGEFSDPDNSASRHAKKERPDYDDMVRRTEAGECDVIVSWESSRLSRDIEVFTRLANLCERNGVLLCLNGAVYDMRNSQQRFFAQFAVLQGGYESDAIRDRALRTMAALARDGRPTGMVPFGYVREYDPATGKGLRQVPDEVTAPIVSELTRRVAAGVPLMQLAREMTERGVPMPKGGSKWQPTTVRHLVLRQTNLGKRVHQGRVLGDAAWPAIVDEADFYAAAKVLLVPGRRPSKDTSVKNLMSGLALCPDGHRIYTLGGAKIKNKPYICTTCHSVSMRVALLDDLVTAAVLAYVERPEFAAALAPVDADGEARAALALASTLEDELEQARTLAGTVVNGRLALSVADFAVISAQLTEQIEAARARAQDATVPRSLQRIAGPSAREVWAASNLHERRAVIREVVKVTLNKARVKGMHHIEPGRVSWEWLR
jgi:site-specific DNA recombinase